MKWIWVSLFGAFEAFAAPAAAEPASTGSFELALREADRRFTEGDLSGALSVLEPACRGSDRPDCAFNLGAIHHGLGHCEQAYAHYRLYRELAPTGEHLQEVEAALEEVEPRCGPAKRAATAQGPRSAPALAEGPLPAAHESSPVPPASSSSSPSSAFMTGSFVLSGVAAASSVVFGILAARSASRCDRASSYDAAFVEECERRGPSYHGMWQGFAVASGGFLSIGLTLWWLDARASPSVGVSGAGAPALQYRYTF